MRRVLLGALLLWSCDDAGLSVHVPWPGSTTDRSVLVAHYGDTMSLWAADLGGSRSHLELDVAPDSQGAIQAITFTQPLASLRLLPGPQAAGQEGAPRPLELDGGGEAWSLVLQDEQATWSPQDAEAMPAELRNFPLLLDLPPCTNFGPAHWSETHERERTTFAVGLGDKGWVGASEFDATGELRLSDRLYEASASGVRPIASPLPGTWPSAATRDGNYLYLGAIDGSVWRLDATRLDLSPIQVRVPGGDRITAISGGRTADGRFELVTLSKAGVTQFLGADGSWSPPLATPAPKIDEIGWAEPGLAFVRSAKPGSIWAVTVDQFEEQPSGGNGQVMSFSFQPNPGRLFAGTDDGSLFVRDPSVGWRAVNRAPNFGWWVIGIEPYSEGLFLLLASGSIAEFHPDRGLCDDSSVLNFLSAGEVAALQDGSLLVVGFDFPFSYFTLLPRVP